MGNRCPARGWCRMGTRWPARARCPTGIGWSLRAGCRMGIWRSAGRSFLRATWELWALCLPGIGCPLGKGRQARTSCPAGRGWATLCRVAISCPAGAGRAAPIMAPMVRGAPARSTRMPRRPSRARRPPATGVPAPPGRRLGRRRCRVRSGVVPLVRIARRPGRRGCRVRSGAVPLVRIVRRLGRRGCRVRSVTLSPARILRRPGKTGCRTRSGTLSPARIGRLLQRRLRPPAARLRRALSGAGMPAMV